MKKYLLFFIIICLSFNLVFSDEDQSLLNRYRNRYLVTLNKVEDIKNISEYNIPVDDVFGKQVYLYATPYEVEVIKRFGFKIEAAPVIIGENTRDYSYKTYQELTDKLKQLEADYPNIAKLYSIGQSEKGKELWILKISDNVAQDESEPEMRYVSTMHGDEVVGQEVMIYLAELLLSEYGKTSRITNLVNNLEIWIMPCMNPDGTESKRRYNANWVDLNRDFPNIETGSTNSRAIETQNMKAFSLKHNFVLSLNYHGGAVVANYPWDVFAKDIEDKDLAIFLCKGYAIRNKPMYNSSQFPEGITNGYAWYKVSGSMQDWFYAKTNCLDITIEISQSKWPSASTLPGYWDDNKESLLWHLEQGLTALSGIVKDNSGNPVKAKINVVNTGKAIYSSSNNGDFHRILLPGKYTLEITADGYQTVTKEVEIQTGKAPSSLNITLQKN